MVFASPASALSHHKASLAKPTSTTLAIMHMPQVLNVKAINAPPRASFGAAAGIQGPQIQYMINGLYLGIRN